MDDMFEVDVQGWAHDVIWWHAYPLGFTGAEHEALPTGTPAVPRLRQFEAWLEHLIGLGANGLALGPVFASETHGYDTVDHLEVDRRLGTVDDLRALFAACHDRGIRVLLDGVFNHVGRSFAPFQDVLRHGRDSAYADWFRIDWDAPGDDGFAYADFEGHQHLVALDHHHPAVADHVVDVMDRWLTEGADGWRLDAAYAVSPSFWRTVVDRVRERHPDAWFVGEVIHAPQAPWSTDAGLDAVTQYELWKAIWSAINDRNLFELQWTLDRHGALTELAPPMTFLGNHDVTRIASKLGDGRHLEHATVLLLTLPGIPSVYAGDEWGFTGVKEDRAGGDDAVRPTFPADPSELSSEGQHLLHRYQELIALRRRHRWLTTATVRVGELANERMAYHLEDDDHLVVLLNLGDDEARFDGTADELHGSAEVLAPLDGGAEDPWSLAPHAWRILRPVTRDG